jgi:hypothetical protein
MQITRIDVVKSEVTASGCRAVFDSESGSNLIISGSDDLKSIFIHHI